MTLVALRSAFRHGRQRIFRPADGFIVGVSVLPSYRLLSSAFPLSLVLLLAAAGQPIAEECCDPASPFRLGEGYADQPATCESIGGWVERAPQVDARITMSVRGALSAVESDGALTYLVMCAEPGVRVLCVTYSTNDMQPGDVVLFAGGYARVGEKQVMLDPCLASGD